MKTSRWFTALPSVFLDLISNKSAHIMKTILSLLALTAIATLSSCTSVSACKTCCKDKCAECCKGDAKTCDACCKKPGS